eukprot:CAMPEP_0173270786 /NCGR_PEP_ID=MMETSP1143-20121109/439_1 /TAXON_ID=483371 /ORGANISM="non described non described, Strain CCMP2298" /LENGTH=394 /DNA_ID=CAMNT_0014207247 /DNA_START=158 /DNA_END=1343 /DNA_ORIENTATION=-
MIFTVLAVILLGYVSAFVPSGRPPHPHPHPQHQRLSMHFEESAIGNTALPQEALPAARYVACNRFKVRKNAGPKFEQRWANRKSRLAELEGFRFFSLMKRVGSEEHDYEGEFGNYVSMTVWESKDDFDAWRTGDAFKEAHGGGGLSSFVQLLSTALFVLDGAPKPSFYDALLPVAGEPLSFPSEGGWRSVEADGRNYLPPDLFMGQTRFCVRPGEEVGFERAWKQRQAGVGAGAGAAVPAVWAMTCWLDALIDELMRLGVFSPECRPNNVLVNEYSPEEGILHHTDGPLYFHRVAVLSLGSDCVLSLRRNLSPSQIGQHFAGDVSSVVLRRRSLFVFENSAYSAHKHGIEGAPLQVVGQNGPCANGALANAPDCSEVRREGPRISLTFRQLLVV